VLARERLGDGADRVLRQHSYETLTPCPCTSQSPQREHATRPQVDIVAASHTPQLAASHAPQPAASCFPRCNTSRNMIEGCTCTGLLDVRMPRGERGDLGRLLACARRARQRQIASARVDSVAACTGAPIRPIYPATHLLLPCAIPAQPYQLYSPTLPALLATPTSSTRQPYQLYSPYSANPALLALLYPTSSTRSTLLTHALYPLDPAIEYAVCGSVSMQGHGCSFPRTPVALPSALPASRSSALSLPSPFPRCLPGRRTRRGELVISCIGLLHLLSGSSSVWRVEPRVCRPCSAARAQG